MEKIILKSEQAMLSFGAQLAENLETPVVFEFIGDVGTGKTTLTRGLAQGLNIQTPVTSPSFTISKRYAAPNGKTLTHYDFYRLPDPGLMADDLAESLADENNITVVEWAGQVDDLLPPETRTYKITLNDDSSRAVEQITRTEINPEDLKA